MNSPARVPRPDQIAELTRGVDLPLAAIDDVYLHVIADGVVQAFEEIRQSATETVATGDETEVTALLEARLNRMIEEDQVWRQLVASVVRGKESLSFDGAHLEKRPDLSIHLTSRTRRFPLIAEAKIIDAARGEQLYCRQGLQRFLNGEYAWGGREALMIAYVRDGSTIETRLTPYLALPAQATNYAVESAPTSLGLGLYDASRTGHRRSFLYTHTPPPANDPGGIALWHLWVDASAAAAT
ncbi:hypothetical protein ABOK31_35830 (plasmid) [Rhizobium sp. ZPR4]|uniref:Restriction endonuclease n=1 Tax=Rhizobium sp. ZPR4 TaxID=3158966 RepID=A0AAU7SRZ3_9HYPH